MGWFRNLFKSRNQALEDLVQRLTTYGDEGTFLNALREATSFAPKGIDLGVRAMSEAIRRRSGKHAVNFYAPSFGGLTMRMGDELVEAEPRLLQLANSGALLEDPAASQNLISAALSVSSDGLYGLVRQIFASAGAESAYDFQLLFNQMNSSLKLRHARGERSWTEQMTGKAS